MLVNKEDSKIVSFHFIVRPFYFPNRFLLKKSIRQLFRKERTKLSCIKYIFCSDSFLLDLNNRFLSHNYYTDIITFNLSDNHTIVGEIYISIDRVRENARLLKVGFQVELRRVIIHGALHLCGYQDKSKKEKSVMRLKEDHYLLLLG